ncbi:MAG: L-serine ammonia-lyase, iron-sulfur-dependent, subunit alpha [Spirochaetales bacterium]|nr:L-serine ammonia-lyase, iron-sulfur-dependent, subunit alpha [Candidatus Physcosoma equi]
MESLRELYRIGYGPSSSHTMGPRAAAERFVKEHEGLKKVKVELYGSLAATGKGHLTDKAILDVLKANEVEPEVIWYPTTFKPFHPNAVTFIAVEPEAAPETYYSVGGGKIVKEGEDSFVDTKVYPDLILGDMEKMLHYCDYHGYQMWEVAMEYEGESIMEYAGEVWEVMKAAIRRGLENEGVLPGGLKLQRKACLSHAKSIDFAGSLGNTSRAISYALAVSEENAGGGRIVTAPTCGSCGVLPGALYYIQQEYNAPDVRIQRAILTAGLVGNIVKTNGSISGAEVGCQGEVGVACAMASAAVAQLLGGSIYQIEYAAEMGLEHHLGLTCDPLMGLVQVPCIERNAMACMRAIDHASFALMGDGRHKVSFDNVVEVMMETGEALPSLYRETSQGGLARVVESK